jgi:hypothetical protein
LEEILEARNQPRGRKENVWLVRRTIRRKGVRIMLSRKERKEKIDKMIGTEEMVIMMTKKLFAEMSEDETETEVLWKVIGFLFAAYRSAQDPLDNIAAVA